MSIWQWFTDLIGDVVNAEAIDFVVTPALTVGGTLPVMAPLKPGASYLSIKVKSLRLPYTRRITSKLYGVVHAFANLPGAGRESKEFVSATTPSALAGLDPKNVSNVITIDKPVVGPTPWNNGDLRLQIGLFSVVEEELAGPFLQTMTSLSEKAGVSLATAKPFLDVISAGVASLTRVVGSVKLEIGKDQTLTPPVPGHYAVIAAPIDSLKSAKFDLDPTDGKLLVNGNHYVDKPYLVYTIEAAERQDRWGDIPDLRSAYQRIDDASRDNDLNKAKDARNSFRLLALTSGDLTLADATKLVAEVDDKLKTIFSSANVSRPAGERALPPFETLALY